MKSNLTRPTSPPAVALPNNIEVCPHAATEEAREAARVEDTVAATEVDTPPLITKSSLTKATIPTEVRLVATEAEEAATTAHLAEEERSTKVAVSTPAQVRRPS